MNIVEQPSESARKYCVLRKLGSWRVELEGRNLGVFQEATEAVDVACRLARHDAPGGRPRTPPHRNSTVSRRRPGNPPRREADRRLIFGWSRLKPEPSSRTA